MAHQVVFLDRDGPVNVDHGFVGILDKWEFSPGALQGMKLLAENGYILTVVTNQSGIAIGKYSEDDMQALHEHMKTEVAKTGATIAAVAFCPHSRDSTCECRKPKTGMAQQIENQIGAIDYAASWIIGDKIADIQFGQAKGMKTALMRSKYWTEAEVAFAKPDLIVDSLLDAAQHIAAANSQ